MLPDSMRPGSFEHVGRLYYFGGHWLKVGDARILTATTRCFGRSFHGAAQCFRQHGICSAPGRSALQLSTVLGVNATGKRDNFVGLQRPTTVTLAGSGLVSSGAFASSRRRGNRTDDCSLSTIRSR